MATSQRYLLWENDGWYSFRIGNDVFKVEKSNKRYRDLLLFLNRWADEEITRQESQNAPTSSG